MAFYSLESDKYWCYLFELIYHKLIPIYLAFTFYKYLKWNKFFLKSFLLIFVCAYSASIFLDIYSYITYNILKDAVNTRYILYSWVGFICFSTYCSARNYEKWLKINHSDVYDKNKSYKVISKPNHKISIWLLVFFRPYSVGYVHKGKYYYFSKTKGVFLVKEYFDFLSDRNLIEIEINSNFLNRLKNKVGTKFSLINNCLTL